MPSPVAVQQVSDSLMTPQIHSIWLLPSAGDEQVLADVIVALSQRFETPLFAPHLTIRGDTDAPLATLEAGLAHAAAVVAAFSEPVAAIETSDAYFRSFYARLAICAPLATLKQRLDGQASEAFMPHISLLYGTVAPGPKTLAAAEVARDLTGRGIRFDRLCVVTSGQDIPIAEWRVVAEARLA